jgi:arylsulfatase A-like enzyme
MKRCDLQTVLSVCLGLFILLSLPAVMCSASPKSGTFNMVLITIDTLRADHLSCYGYERKTSPVIDAIAENGIVCSNVFAPSSWTAPSMTSVFTSVYPVNHGVVHGIGYTKDSALNVQEIFSSDLTTLTEVLHEHGYSTFGVSANPHLSEKFRFDRGFDYFTCLPFEDAKAVNEAAFAWEDKIKKAGKYFLWVHYIDPHYPYTAQKPWIRSYASEAETRVLLNLSPESWWGLKTLVKDVKDDPKLLKHLIALYDSEINYADAHVGMLMERFGLYEDTLVLITSDHGEEFLEHGETGHGHNLYQPSLHVPLIVKLPNKQLERTSLSQPMSLINVMPTILEIAGLDAPATAMGVSFRKKDGLFSWIKKKLSGADEDYIYAELDTMATLKAVIAPPWKYIYNRRDKTGQLYNIISDPLELNDRAQVETGESDRLKNELLRWAETTTRYPAKRYDVELSPEEKEKLKGLGYLQ